MKRIEKEKEIVGLMIKLYCIKHHMDADSPCHQCLEILEYAKKQLNGCKHGDSKGFCSKCTAPCYRQDMRARIKEIMKFSGPRLILYEPYEFVKHIIK